MSESAMVFVTLGSVIVAMMCCALACAGCCWLVWSACKKSNGLDAADRVIAANAEVMRRLGDVVTVSVEYANGERQNRANEQWLAVWLAKQIVAANEAGKDGKPIEFQTIPEPPDELSNDITDNLPGSDPDDDEGEIDRL